MATVTADLSDRTKYTLAIWISVGNQKEKFSKFCKVFKRRLTRVYINLLRYYVPNLNNAQGLIILVKISWKFIIWSCLILNKFWFKSINISYDPWDLCINTCNLSTKAWCLSGRWGKVNWIALRGSNDVTAPCILLGHCSNKYTVKILQDIRVLNINT